MAKKKTNCYGFDRIINIIIAIIPFTNLIFGIVKRALSGNVIGAVLNFFLFPLFYIVDIITVILSNKLVLLA